MSEGLEVTFELASTLGERCKLRVELTAPGVLTVSDGPPELRGRWTGEDWFGATCELRRRAESLGWRALIGGAQVNVWPTLAQRDAGGLSVTRLERNRDAQRCVGAVVELFEPAPLELVTSVREQSRHWRDWLEQPARRPKLRDLEARDNCGLRRGHLVIATPADDPRLAFVGATLGWWRIDERGHFDRPFRANPRLVRVVGRRGKRTAEVLLEAKPREDMDDLFFQPWPHLHPEWVRLRLCGAAMVDAIGRGPDAFVALADLRERIAAYGRQLCVQGATERAWRYGDDGLTVKLATIGYKYGPTRDLLDRAAVDELVSVEHQRYYRQMFRGLARLTDEVLAWARAEPESWRPVIGAHWSRRGSNIMGWWRSDAWGRPTEFRANPLRLHGLVDPELMPDLYPLEGE